MKNRAISFIFCGILFAILIVNLITPDKVISLSERRPLAEKPQITVETIISNKAGEETEKYFADQFAGRDCFSKLKAATERKLLMKYDSNNMYVVNGNAFKVEYPLNNKSVISMADKIGYLYDEYFENCNVAIGIIPDKSHYMVDNSKYLRIDYDELMDVFKKELQKKGTAANLIDLESALELENYYDTDLHWRQDRLLNVVGQIAIALGNDEMYKNIKDVISSSKKNSYKPFYGAYYGQALVGIEPDTLVYLTNQYTDEAIVTDYDEGKKEKAENVYHEEKLGTVDSYEVFFAGNSPLITIENPKNKSGRELVIFKDSFGNSLAPLFISEYSKITMVDLRFIPSEFVGKFVLFDNQDVVILYSQAIVQNSDMIK